MRKQTNLSFHKLEPNSQTPTAYDYHEPTKSALASEITSNQCSLHVKVETSTQFNEVEQRPLEQAEL
jgi:hypothetical protein